MCPRVSAGLLIYRIYDGKLQMLLAHPGGPVLSGPDPRIEIGTPERCMILERRYVAIGRQERDAGVGHAGLRPGVVDGPAVADRSAQPTSDCVCKSRRFGVSPARAPRFDVR